MEKNLDDKLVHKMVNDMPQESFKRKKDYVSIIAVILFALMIIFELSVLYNTARHAHGDKRWEREILIEETQEILDLLRAHMTGIKPRVPEAADEIELAFSCLDEYARYLKDEKGRVSKAQISEIHSKIQSFNGVYQLWKAREKYLKEIQFSPDIFILKQIKRFEKDQENL